MTVKQLIIKLKKMPQERRIVLHSSGVLSLAVDVSTWDDCIEHRHEVWITDYEIDRSSRCTKPDLHTSCATI